MRLYRTKEGIIVQQNDSFYILGSSIEWDQLINRDDLYDHLSKLMGSGVEAINSLDGKKICCPVGSQEIWAAGVTYYSSRLARMEESQDAGGGDFYSRVYVADRPEIFFKATPARTVGPGEEFKTRKDSTWDVPEPELTLFVTSNAKIVGYTIGNDVSSRSIEGENPLYLPQAKTFDNCACLGPCILVPETPLPPKTSIEMKISRESEVVFEGKTSLQEMKRKPEELVDYLFRETSFAQGVFLMTGTGIVPGTEFSLQQGDLVEITIPSIGTLSNTVGA